MPSSIGVSTTNTNSAAVIPFTRVAGKANFDSEKYAGTWVVALKHECERVAVEVHILYTSAETGKHLNLTDIHNAITRVYHGHNVTSYPQYLALSQEKFNVDHDRLEVQGTAQIKITSKQDGNTFKIELFDGDNGVNVNQHVFFRGAETDNGRFYADVQRYAKAFSQKAMSDKFARLLTLWEYEHVGMITNLAHWYQLKSTGIIKSTLHGIEDIDAFALPVFLIDYWWGGAVRIVQQWHPATPDYDAPAYIDAIGMAALCVAVGPYTTVPDKRDTRNDQFDSWFDRGDCDKNAISGAALYTMLIKMTAADTKKISNLLARAIITQWKKTRGEAIILHLKTDTDTAHGKTAGKTGDPSAWAGHCTMMITEKGWTPGKPLCKSLFGEMTRATAPHVLSPALSHCTFEQAYSRLARSVNAPTFQSIAGQGEIKVLNTDIYPEVAQFLTSKACFIMCYKNSKFPSLRDIMTQEWAYAKMTLAPKGCKVPANMITRSTKNLSQIITRDHRADKLLDNMIKNKYRIINPKADSYTSQFTCKCGPVTYGFVRHDLDGTWHFPPENILLQDITAYDHCMHSTRVVGYDP
jgi:hypothetical protein